MRQNCIWRRLQALLLLGALLCLPLSALAYDLIDPQHPTSLTLHVTDGAQALPNVPFDIYRVATIDRTGRYTLTPAFAPTGLSINAGDQADRWQRNLDALVEYAPSVRPAYTLTSDAKGLVVMPGLSRGLYLALGRKTQVGSYMYSFIPALVSLPNPSGDHWTYAVDAEIKKEREKTRIDIEVVKLWQDKGYRDTRSSTVQVELLMNGVHYQTVQLSAANNWRYAFEGLDNHAEWSIREIGVPSGYEASYSRSGDTLYVTNTLEDVPSSGGGGGGKLPQTGQVWWPVPALASSGMLLFVTGYIKRKRRVDHEEV